MDYRFAMIPGDGIGPEVTRATADVLEALGLRIDWVVCEAGAAAERSLGTPLPKATIEAIRRHRVALKGPVGTPIGKGFRSVNVALRKRLNLYASLRPVRSFPGVVSPWRGVDVVIVRENTEGLYAGLEHQVAPGVAVAVKMITREATDKIARFAFDYAKVEGRRRITVAHKATVMRMSDGLFIDVVQEVARDYPFIRVDFMEIDRAALLLAQDPSQFDVLLLENLFGDIFSDIAAGLVGGLGLVPGANIGPNLAVFEAVHGTAPDIAGRGLANPMALILSASMMLHYVGERRRSAQLVEAVAAVLEEGKVRTGDLGGSHGTADMTQAIIDRLPLSQRASGGRS